jgi:hypothetical protein
MPTYEHLDDAGDVVERSTTFDGTPFDEQMRATAADPASGWYVAATADAPRHKLDAVVKVPAPPSDPGQPAPPLATQPTTADQPPSTPPES